MLNFYTKYLFILFWLLQVLQQTNIPFNFKPYLYIIMGISLIFTFVLLSKNSSFFFNKAFLVIHLVLLIYVFYWIMFDQSVFGLQYIISKIAIYGLMAATIFYQYDFVEKKLLRIILMLGMIILIFGLVTNLSFGSRYGGPFGNPNSLGFFSVMLFGIVLFQKEKNRLRTFLLIFFILMALASGSRAALGGIVLAYLIKEKVSFKKLAILFISFAILFGINKLVTSYGFTTGIDRVISTSKKHDLLAGRDLEYKLGLDSIKENPITGHGLDHYAHLSDTIVKKSGILRIDANFALNPHNSFIALFIQLGIPFGIILLSILFYYVGKSFFFKPRHGPYLILILYPFLAGFFESFLFGVSGFEGTTFWFALMFYQYYMLRQSQQKMESYGI